MNTEEMALGFNFDETALGRSGEIGIRNCEPMPVSGG
jgi:hypothetical protein